MPTIFTVFQLFKQSSPKWLAGLVEYLLVFDIRGVNNTLRLRLNRELHSVGAEKIQQSVWKLDDLITCHRLAALVNSNGGRAFVVPMLIIK